MILTLNTAIHFLHKKKNLWFILMYYQTKFGSKRISSSKDTVEIVIFWSCGSCSDLDNSKSIFLHDTPTHNDASQYQVWKQNVWWLRRYHLEKHNGETWTFWPFAVALTLNAVILSFFFLFFPHDTLAYDDVSSDQVWLPRNQQFRRYSRKSNILNI